MTPSILDLILDTSFDLGKYPGGLSVIVRQPLYLLIAFAHRYRLDQCRGSRTK